MSTLKPTVTKKRINKGNILSHAFVWVFILFTLFPIYIVIESSFNNGGALSTNSLIPSGWSWINFKTLFHDPSVPFMRWMFNSCLLYTSDAADE